MDIEYWQQLEIRDVVAELVECDQPANEVERRQLIHEWKSLGYEAIIEAYTYLNRQRRKARTA